MAGWKVTMNQSGSTTVNPGSQLLDDEKIPKPVENSRSMKCEHFSKNFSNRPLEHTKTTPNQQFMKEFLNHLGLWGCLGYAPGVCWGFLRNLHFLDG